MSVGDEKTMSEQIRTEQLPCFPEKLTPHGAECWIAGWGQTENSGQSSELRSITINSMNREYCINENHRLVNTETISFHCSCSFYNIFLVLAIPRMLLLVERNSVLVFRLMVASSPVRKLSVKEILVVLYSVMSMDTSPSRVYYHDRHHSKITVVFKGILASSSIFTPSPSGFEKVFSPFLLNCSNLF